MAFPFSKLSLTVELALGADLTGDPFDWVWTDVTSYVRITSGTAVQITRGGYDGAIQAPPSTCSFTADNRDGRWVATNPTGAWYGQIQKNTPIRVKTAESSASVRWTGFLSALPPRWDPSENDRYVTVRASGIFQRHQRGVTPLRTALVRMFTSTSTPPKAYWPCEDGAASTTIAEFFGGKPMAVTGTGLSLASDGPDGSDPLPEFSATSGGFSLAEVPTHSPTGAWGVALVLRYPSTPASNQIFWRWRTSGTLPSWRFIMTSAGALTVEADDAAGTTVLSSSVTYELNGVSAFGTWVILQVAAVQNGVDIDWAMHFGTQLYGTGTSGTITGQTAGTVSRLERGATANLDGVGMGHFAAWDIDLDPLGFSEIERSALDGHSGDTVTVRAVLLGNEGGMGVEIDTTSPLTMGPESRGSALLDLIRECDAVGGGRLYENRDPTPVDAFLRFKHAGDLSNQTAALTINHDSAQLGQPFEPTDDDQQLRNDWTVTRTGGSGIGSSARKVAVDGNLKPEDVGTYDDSTSVNVETDADLIHQASWRVNVGTVEGLRFPVVTLNLARSPSLIASWITCDIGSRITITNPPAGIAPDDIDLLIEGWTETLGPHEWTVTLNCSPYKPWHVFVIADTTAYDHDFLGRLAASDACALRTAITSGATSMQVDPNGDWWTETADDFDPDLGVRVGGEVVSVSAIATTAATFVAAGTADHDDNASLTPGLPAGVQAGDLLLIFAAIRSSGTGTVNTPTGYTRLPVFNSTDNVQLFGKIHSGSESTPTVSFTGGAAGDTTSAQMAAFRNVPQSLTDLSDIVVQAATQLNASAQDIAFPTVYPWDRHRTIVLALGWKQDDWTSVATATGYTAEIGEPASTTGGDQGLVWDYIIQTTPAAISATSFVVTGGASAISRGAVVALAGGYQTHTISARSLNGVTKAHSAGARVEVEDPGVMGL